MDHKQIVFGQVSVQVKKCSLGWIWSVKLMTVAPDSGGVKWLTLGEDVIAAFDVTQTPREFVRKVVSDALKQIG